MRAIVQAVVHELLQTAGQKHRPEVTVKDLPSAEGDPVLIRQVFANLLSNAIKFTKDKDPTQIEVGGLTGTGESIFYVKDNGAGLT